MPIVTIFHPPLPSAQVNSLLRFTSLHSVFSAHFISFYIFKCFPDLQECFLSSLWSMGCSYSFFFCCFFFFLFNLLPVLLLHFFTAILMYFKIFKSTGARKEWSCHTDQLFHGPINSLVYSIQGFSYKEAYQNSIAIKC